MGKRVVGPTRATCSAKEAGSEYSRVRGTVFPDTLCSYIWYLALRSFSAVRTGTVAVMMSLFTVECLMASVVTPRDSRAETTADTESGEGGSIACTSSLESQWPKVEEEGSERERNSASRLATSDASCLRKNESVMEADGCGADVGVQVAGCCLRASYWTESEAAPEGRATALTRRARAALENFIGWVWGRGGGEWVGVGVGSGAGRVGGSVVGGGARSSGVGFG